MPKGSVQGGDVATSAVRLRDMLRELEIGLANLKGRGEGVAELLRLRDDAEGEFARLRKDMDLRPEQTRLETIDNILERKASAIMRELRLQGGLPGLRRTLNPPEEHWWWYLDLKLAEKQRKSAIRTIILVVGAIVLIFGADYILNHFFGMDPVEREARGFVSQGEEQLMARNWDAAIAEYEKAVALKPNLPEAQAALGVLYAEKGQIEQSEAALAAAEASAASREEYLSILARMYQMAEKFEEALEAVNEAIAIAPQSAYAFLIRGGIYESQGRLAEAMQDYSKSASLAQEQGQNSLYVLAQMRYGMLLERGPSLGWPGM